MFAIANHADQHGGNCWASVGRLAKESKMSERGVQANLRILEAAKEIILTGQHSLGGDARRSTNIYAILGMQKLHPTGDPGVQDSSLWGEDSVDPGVKPASPKPSLRKPSDKPGGSAALACQPWLTKKGKPRQVDEQDVTQAEWEMAAGIMDAWNEGAGSSQSVEANHGPVIMRIRLKPQYTLHHHQRIIKAFFVGEAWWKGAPTINLIYGNDGQFERCVEHTRLVEANGGSASKSATPELDAEDYLLWKEGKLPKSARAERHEAKLRAEGKLK